MSLISAHYPYLIIVVNLKT